MVKDEKSVYRLQRVAVVFNSQNTHAHRSIRSTVQNILDRCPAKSLIVMRPGSAAAKVYRKFADTGGSRAFLDFFAVVFRVMLESFDGSTERKSRELAKRSAKLQIESEQIRAKSEALVAK